MQRYQSSYRYRLARNKVTSYYSRVAQEKSRKQLLSKTDKQCNQKLASERALNENVIGYIKRFKMIADRYRNRRRRFQLRFNLISEIHNMEITL